MCNLGRYIEYKGNAFIVVKEEAKQVHINSIEHGRFKINKTSCKQLKCEPAKVITYRDMIYIVTGAGNIFGNQTGRLMNWPDNHDTRKYIMEKTS